EEAARPRSSKSPQSHHCEIANAFRVVQAPEICNKILSHRTISLLRAFEWCRAGAGRTAADFSGFRFVLRCNDATAAAARLDTRRNAWCIYRRTYAHRLSRLHGAP